VLYLRIDLIIGRRRRSCVGGHGGRRPGQPLRQREVLRLRETRGVPRVRGHRRRPRRRPELLQICVCEAAFVGLRLLDELPAPFAAFKGRVLIIALGTKTLQMGVALKSRSVAKRPVEMGMG